MHETEDGKRMTKIKRSEEDGWRIWEKINENKKNKLKKNDL